MSVLRVLLVLLVSAVPAFAADPPLSLRTLDGKTLSGELIGIDAKEVKLKIGGRDVATPLDKVVQIDFQPMPPGVPPRDAFTAVELTDGSKLRCSKFAVRGKEATLTLTAGQEFKVPLGTVTYVLNEANNETLVKQFRDYLAKSKQQRSDFLLVKRDDVLNGLDGTVGDGDEKGENVEFTRSGAKRNISLAKVQGIIFQREADPNMTPAVCKVLDTARNEIMAASVSKSKDGIAIVTPAGAKIDYPRKLIARLDYSKGKLTFLSDMDPSEVVETCTEGADSVQHYHRDKNLDGGPIRVGPTGFGKGLSMHAHTELEYDLKGEYREFKAYLGVEESIGGGDGPTVVKILGDGKELISVSLKKGEKLNPKAIDKAKSSQTREAKDNPSLLPITLSVVNVLKLRIVVASGDLLDLGKHATLGEALVSK
jgi:hypothetical protein